MTKDHGKEVEFQTNGYIICIQWSPEKDAPGFLKPGNSGGKSNRTEEQGIMKKNENAYAQGTPDRSV